MSGTFDCPACGATLEIPDGGAATVTCAYCGKTVIIPEELRDEAPVSASGGISAVASVGEALEQAARLAEIAALVRQGKKIEAIKEYRQLTGLGLKESKDVIDRFEQGGPLEYTNVSVDQSRFVSVEGDVDQAALLGRIRELLDSNQKIEAIKAFRQAYDTGLKESKDIVDEIESGARTSLDGYFPRSGAPKAEVEEPTAMRTARPVPNWVWALLVVVILACTILPFFFSSIAAFAPLAFLYKFFGVPSQIATPMAEISTQTSGLQFPGMAPGVGSTPFVLQVRGPARVLLAFGGQGSGPGRFDDARSIAVDRSNGNIYVAEYQGGRVQAFDSSGKFLTQWRLPDQDAIITDMAAGRDGVVYIASGGGVVRYDGATGALIGPLQIEGNADYVDSLALRASGELVLIAGGEDILWLDAGGKIVQTLPDAISSVSSDSELDTRLAVDGRDEVYALGRFNNAVFRFGPDGKYLNRFGSDGDQPGQFRAPYAIAVDDRSRVYVSDIHGIQVFESSGRFLDTIDPAGGVVMGMAFNDQNELFVVANDGQVTQYALTFGE